VVVIIGSKIPSTKHAWVRKNKRSGGDQSGVSILQHNGIMTRRTRIGPDGSLIQDGDENETNGGGGSGGAGSGSGGGRRRLLSCPSRLPHRIDLFGFHLELKHFALVLLLVSLTMGSIGLMLFLSFLAMYTYYQRQSTSSSSSGGRSGGARWKDGKATGSNIKGVGDLPKPPKG
jgi:hypothetical protein